MHKKNEPFWDEFLEIEGLLIPHDKSECDDKDDRDPDKIIEYDIFNPPDSDPYP